MQCVSCLVRAAVLAAAWAVSSVQAEAPRYRAEVIGTSRTDTGALALNNEGVVAGRRQFGNGEPGHFIYRDGRIERLQGLDGLAELLDINDRGEIAGRNYLPNRFPYAMIYRDGRGIDISAPLGFFVGDANATAINEAGHAVGYAGSRLFFHDGQTTRYVSHPDLDNRAMLVARDLNDQDAFVGFNVFDARGDDFAFVVRDGQLTRIPGLDGGWALQAHALNNAGQVVGATPLPGFGYRPYLYSNGVTTELGSLRGGDPHENAEAVDINEQGWIVGASYAPDSDGIGFLYQDGRMHRIEDLVTPAAAARWDVFQPLRINDMGQILASAVDARGKVSYTLLLSPVPEPEAWVVALAGIGLVGAVVRRRRYQAS
ncbi:PEP-CTERM sorting domain-containing protein [Azohydromonas caseinilytica]|uniref:PEP-CTERM sorting domain-containing protein n=1 Tax=Azohydromonas caseinilytica TaxID=2728836 RepID=A0A848F8J6_9BURK|nr:PEP-CTERM sorting domain-containing protein [Azohydromonas caseinilytica]NML15682.1 PEP-CTERM sorting domain-containing protein [Azohydromonas caseinilytica]